jgi:hypothetical protein
MAYVRALNHSGQSKPKFGAAFGGGVQQAFGQHASQRRNVELHKIREVAIEDTLQCLAQRRMIPSDRKNAQIRSVNRDSARHPDRTGTDLAPSESQHRSRSS